MTNNETTGPGYLHIDEVARGTGKERLSELAERFSGTIVVAPGGTPLAAGEDTPRRFVAREPSVSRFERRKAARAERRNAARGE